MCVQVSDAGTRSNWVRDHLSNMSDAMAAVCYLLSSDNRATFASNSSTIVEPVHMQPSYRVFNWRWKLAGGRRIIEKGGERELLGKNSLRLSMVRRKCIQAKIFTNPYFLVFVRRVKGERIYHLFGGKVSNIIWLTERPRIKAISYG